MNRVNIKIGDVFSADLGNNEKKYFQYVGNDISQLNSDVIRLFNKSYPIDAKPELNEIVSEESHFYAHCIIKIGIKMKLWAKTGNCSALGDLSNVLFRGTNDYGRKLGEEPCRKSDNWYVWKISEPFLKVGKLEGNYKKAFIGLVFNPFNIIELMKGNKSLIENYPE